MYTHTHAHIVRELRKHETAEQSIKWRSFAAETNEEPLPPPPPSQSSAATLIVMVPSWRGCEEAACLRSKANVDARAVARAEPFYLILFLACLFSGLLFLPLGCMIVDSLDVGDLTRGKGRIEDGG